MKLVTIIFTAMILFFASAISFAQEAVEAVATSMAPDGELEDATLGLVDAFKVGQIGAIIFAIITLMKTRVGLMVLNFLILKFAGKKQQPVVMEPAKDAMDELAEKGYGTLDLGQPPQELQKLPSAAINGTNVLLGAGAAVAQAMGQGMPMKTAVITGLLGSGVATAAWEMLVKPLVKKLAK